MHNRSTNNINQGRSAILKKKGLIHKMATKKKVKTYSSFLNNSIDFTLLIVLLILLALGLTMVLSASSPKSLSDYGTSYHFFIRQLIFALVGLGLMMIISKIDYRFYQKFYKISWIVSVILLVLVLLIGKEVNESKRWIEITSSLSFQPSEIVKFLMIVFYAGILTRNRDELGNFWMGLVKHVCMIAPIIVLLLLEPHFSVSIVIIGTCCVMMIMAGCKFWQFAAAGGAIGVPAIVAMVMMADYRLVRVNTFLDPWSDPKGAGWQVIQSLYAIGSGGLFGLGLGEGNQKYLYLSEPQNDFIFAILAEELGFVGCVFVIILFAILIWRGILIAMKAPDMFGSLMAIGIISLIAIQVIINIAVVTSSMPVTGMPLPFFSYGGTSLLILLCEVSKGA